METTKFTKSIYDYSIQYDSSLNSVDISIIHNTDFFAWFKTISYDLNDNSSDDIKVKIPPKSLYNVFKKYDNKTLDKSINLILPTEYKDENQSLSIEIKTISPFDPLCYDTKTILIDPIMVSTEKRFESKLMLRDTKINTLYDKIETLTNIIDHQYVHLYNLNNRTNVLEKNPNIHLQHEIIQIKSNNHVDIYINQDFMNDDSNDSNNSNDSFDSYDSFNTCDTCGCKYDDDSDSDNDSDNDSDSDNDDSDNDNDFFENLDINKITSNELKNKIKTDDEYEKIFSKLNDLFLNYSTHLSSLEGKRQKVVSLMKLVAEKMPHGFDRLIEPNENATSSDSELPYELYECDGLCNCEMSSIMNELS